jgi:hypothetical protein
MNRKVSKQKTYPPSQLHTTALQMSRYTQTLRGRDRRREPPWYLREVSNEVSKETSRYKTLAMSLIDPRLMSEDKIKKEEDHDTSPHLHDFEVKPPPTPNMESEGSGASGGRTAAMTTANHYSYYIKGRVVLVTGVSPGSLGAAFLQAIASANPADVILAGRDRDKVQTTAQMVTELNPAIRIRLLQLNLLSLDAVRRAAGRIMEWPDLTHIDIVVSSAGIMATEWVLSTDGYESQLATNHLGPFLFINLIMGKILKSKAPRVILVGSGCHRLSHFRFGDYNFQVRDWNCQPRPLGMTSDVGRVAGRRDVQQMAGLRPIQDCQ